MTHLTVDMIILTSKLIAYAAHASPCPHVNYAACIAVNVDSIAEHDMAL